MEFRAQELCEIRGGRPGLGFPVPNSPYGLCGHKATLNLYIPALFIIVASLIHTAGHKMTAVTVALLRLSNVE